MSIVCGAAGCSGCGWCAGVCVGTARRCERELALPDAVDAAGDRLCRARVARRARILGNAAGG